MALVLDVLPLEKSFRVLSCSVAGGDTMSVSVQVAAATVTDNGESVFGQLVLGFKI